MSASKSLYEVHFSIYILVFLVRISGVFMSALRIYVTMCQVADGNVQMKPFFTMETLQLATLTLLFVVYRTQCERNSYVSTAQPASKFFS